MPTIELKMINKFPACSPICFKHRSLWCPFLDSHRTTPLKYRCPFKMSDRVRPTYLTSMMMWKIITCRPFFNNQVNSEKEGCDELTSIRTVAEFMTSSTIPCCQTPHPVCFSPFTWYHVQWCNSQTLINLIVNNWMRTTINLKVRVLSNLWPAYQHYNSCSETKWLINHHHPWQIKI